MKKYGLFSKRFVRKKGPLPLRYVFIISLLFFILFTVQGIWLIDQRIRPALMTIAEMETQKVAVHAIQEAITGDVLQEIDVDDMVHIERNSNGHVTSVNFNSTLYNHVLAETIERVHYYLKNVEAGVQEDGMADLPPQEKQPKDQIIHFIPLGQATNNALLAQLGPKIPVTFSTIGDVKPEINESIEEAGINNTYLRVAIEIEVDIRIYIPFATEKSTVSTTVPLGIVFISGEVPDYYSSGGEGPGLSILPESELEKMREKNKED
ncbi:sporulation protein YunB [Alteribacillus iranensis]|uniref:Sporulation protein YunB n=1 Tax=Alteribacillus iranensis TaxID=930128 RepID=A0A1I2EPQ0_9BACI|nr:sporulation protein YunB [Alteribacillus iranensis]SFE94607.1 sporulation protein YunB [Alteribacillus iranensis]